MSSDADLAQLIDALQSSTVANQCALATVALYIYDYAITFTREIELFWGRRFTGASLLFMLNRYLYLGNIIVAVCNSVRMSDQGCQVYVYFSQATGILPYLVWALFSSMRAYALSRRHRILSATILVLSLVPMVINYIATRWLTPINDPIFGCGGDLAETASLAKQLTIASRTCLMTADALVLAVTWGATFRAARARRTAGFGLTFSSLLLRDGTAYFVVLFILNTLHLTFTLLSVVHIDSEVSYITQFTEPITAILVSRFLLDLQEVNQNLESGTRRSTGNPDSVSQTGTIAFARVVGSLGSMIPSPGGSFDFGSELAYDSSPTLNGLGHDSTRGCMQHEMHSVGDTPT